MTFIKSLREEARQKLAKECTQYGGDEKTSTMLRTDQVIDTLEAIVTTTALKTLEEVERLEDLANSDLDFLRSIKGNSVIQHLRAEIKNDV